MNKAKDIQEGNKLIAEFMKGEVAVRVLGDDPYKYQEEWVVFPADDSFESKSVAKVSQLFRHWNESKKSNLYFRTSSLQYHTSWDWLMPVVEKINKWHSDTNCAKMDFYLLNQSICSSIKMVWEGCIEFIKWYNQNKTS